MLSNFTVRCGNRETSLPRSRDFATLCAMGNLHEMYDDHPLLNVKHLDMVRELKSDNEMSLASELLEHAETDGQDTLDKCLRAAEVHDSPLATQYAHKLKGMTSNLGLMRIHFVFKELERRGRADEEEILSGAEAQGIRELYTESLDAYRRYIDN